MPEPLQWAGADPVAEGLALGCYRAGALPAGLGVVTWPAASLEEERDRSSLA